MTLQELVREIDGSYGNRFQASEKHILRCLDIAQKAAFNHDCRAFERTATLELANISQDLANYFYFSFPEDARQIISIGGISNYMVDFFTRRILCPSPPQDPVSVRYYLRPQTLTATEQNGILSFAQTDEAKLIIPDEWRWQALVQPAVAMLDSQLYGDKSPQSYIESYFKEFWEAMSARPNNRQPVASQGAW